MKYVPGFLGRVVCPLAISLVTISVLSSHAEVQSGQVFVQAVSGTVVYSLNDTSQSLKENMTLTRGAVIKTGTDSTADLVLQYNGSVLRLAPNSILSFDKLNKEAAGGEMITETSLNLIVGSLIGSQRKLASPSSFQINIPGGVATIKGTEYLVRSDGAVTVLSGSVTVIYNLPHNGGSIKVTVGPGFSFDPATGTVVPTTPAFLQNITADVNTVRQNAQVFRSGGATIVVKPQGAVSPTRGNNGVGNGIDPQPPGNPPINDGPGTSPGNPGNKGHGKNKPSQPRTPSTPP